MHTGLGKDPHKLRRHPKINCSAVFLLLDRLADQDTAIERTSPCFLFGWLLLASLVILLIIYVELHVVAKMLPQPWADRRTFAVVTAQAASHLWSHMALGSREEWSLSAKGGQGHHGAAP